MKKLILLLILANVIYASPAFAQSISGTYYLIPERCNKDSAFFQRKSTLSDKNYTERYWSFHDDVLIRGWKRYTNVSGSLYCPYDQQDSHRSTYILDKETNKLKIWYRKKDMKNSAKPSQVIPVVSYEPLILLYDVGSLIHGK